MTLDDLLALPDTDLNRLVAERVMGWYSFNDNYYRGRLSEDLIPIASFRPATDHNDAARVKEEIARRGQRTVDLFVNAMSEMNRGLTFWSCFAATPRQIAAAAIRAAEVLGQVRELEQRANGLSEPGRSIVLNGHFVSEG